MVIYPFEHVDALDQGLEGHVLCSEDKLRDVSRKCKRVRSDDTYNVNDNK